MEWIDYIVLETISWHKIDPTLIFTLYSTASRGLELWAKTQTCVFQIFAAHTQKIWLKRFANGFQRFIRMSSIFDSTESHVKICHCDLEIWKLTPLYNDAYDKFVQCRRGSAQLRRCEFTCTLLRMAIRICIYYALLHMR